MAKDLKCPNCGVAAIEGETGLVCPKCGGTFTFTEGEARLAGVGEYDQLKGRVDAMEAHQAELDELLGRNKDGAPGPADPDEEHEDLNDLKRQAAEEDEDEDEDEDW